MVQIFSQNILGTICFCKNCEGIETLPLGTHAQWGLQRLFCVCLYVSTNNTGWTTVQFKIFLPRYPLELEQWTSFWWESLLNFLKRLLGGQTTWNSELYPILCQLSRSSIYGLWPATHCVIPTRDWTTRMRTHLTTISADAYVQGGSNQLTVEWTDRLARAAYGSWNATFLLVL